MPEKIFEGPNSGAQAAATLRRDNWRDQATFCCRTCRFYVAKNSDPDHPFDADPPHIIGRCRRRAPTMDGFPVVFPTDWCGDHKLATDFADGHTRRVTATVDGLPDPQTIQVSS